MKLRTILISVLIIVILLLIIRQAYLYATDSPYRISAKDAKHRIQQGKIDLILDVRTLLERNTLGFYPGSVHIQSSDLEKMMPNLYPNKQIRILAYCNTGHRARMATDKLHALGYINAVYISSQYQNLL
jgi:rhodanese-related sulfurtransferase